MKYLEDYFYIHLKNIDKNLIIFTTRKAYNVKEQFFSENKIVL